jgi:hypothetical protein
MIKDINNLFSFAQEIEKKLILETLDELKDWSDNISSYYKHFPNLYNLHLYSKDLLDALNSDYPILDILPTVRKLIYKILAILEIHIDKTLTNLESIPHSEKQRKELYDLTPAKKFLQKGKSLATNLEKFSVLNQLKD